MKVLKILKLQGFVWKTMTGWQKLFFSCKCLKLLAAITFMQSLLLRYMTENSQVNYF